jgi:hypothetical protein
MTVTNEYFEATPFQRSTLARSAAVSDEFRAVQAAFDKLPDPGTLLETLGTFFTAGGTANVLTGALTPTLTAYTDGLPFTIRTPLANTSTIVTLNVDGLGARQLKLPNGSPPAVGAIIAGGLMEVVYDATFTTFVIMGAGVLPVVQSSTTDTTSGALLINGAHGLGSSTPPSLSTAASNLTVRSDWYVLAADVATVGGPTGADRGILEHHPTSTTQSKQIYRETDGNGRMWDRLESGGSFGAWQQRSTVQSANVTSGTFTAGGTWRAWHDVLTGLRHVIARNVLIGVGGTTELWTASGNVAFSAEPSIIGTPVGASSSSVAAKLTTASTTQWGFIVVDDTDTSVSASIHFHAIGPY